MKRLVCFFLGHKLFVKWVAYTEVKYSENRVDYVPAGYREHIYCDRCKEFLRFGKWET